MRKAGKGGEALRRTLNNDGKPSFSVLAAELRRLTANRPHTPAEDLQRKGREEC
jgi:plasmid stability protein